ncbi:MAG TPA: WYL domain-containing protein, partial [Peptococcaceae bacterium]|nr:WYL domain-containing protein [Peptococcaceae bacterium]
PTREGWFTVNLYVSVSPVFLSWLFQFGDKARILAPAEVQVQMQQLLQQAISGYENASIFN